MRYFYTLLFLPLLAISLNANALLISSTYVVERQIPAEGSEGTVFDLIQAGYSPATDSITSIKLIYDFTEVWSPENQGDVPRDQEGYPVNPREETLPYEDEFVIFSSWVFNWRDVHADIDTGLTVFATDWTRHNSCQYPDMINPTEEELESCVLNIDVLGNLNAYVTSYTSNLLLHSITAEVEVDRIVVPEPHSIFLFGLGLFAIGFLRNRQKN